MLLAAAALAAVPASALVHGTRAHASRKQSPGRPSLIELHATRPSFSALDRLRARRLGLRDCPSAPGAGASETPDDADRVAGLEYLYDAGEERRLDDMFHVILLPSTFRKEHMSIEHAAESCTEVLGMPSDRAHDLSLFAKHQGFGRLGTWAHDECLSIGEQLRSRDLDCRVVPCSGGGDPPRTAPAMEGSDVTVDAAVLKCLVENSYLLSLGG